MICSRYPYVYYAYQLLKSIWRLCEIFYFKELSELDNSGNLANKMAEILMDQGPMVGKNLFFVVDFA